MSGERILLVEDNDVLREGLKSLLLQEDYRVMEAGDGRQALEKLRETPPDLILADIVMPEMDGYALFEAVRARTEWLSIPFIFLTARRERKYILAGKRLGAEDYLIKPISPEDLLTAIRSRLGRSRQLLLAQLEESYEASLIMLANAIEVRDPYTRGHVERVMNYSLAIAEEQDWTSERLRELRFGSILHDVGKIQIPGEILTKSGPLNEAEWAEMRKHPEVGAELVMGIHYLRPAIPVILYHHERWDGSGYPFGLAGDQVPEAARIVAVADSFDAMTTIRSYRQKSLPADAVDEIAAAAGIKYDPDVVAAFTRAWDKKRIIEIYLAFP
jgi:putative two-component system response regulator